MNDSANYFELAPPASLRGAVACLWVRRGGGATVRVLPDACVDIVWREATGAMVAGPDTGPWLSHTQRGELIVGVRLLPGAGRALGTPVDELRDQRVGLRDLDIIWDPRNERSVVYDLTELATRLVSARPPDRLVQVAAIRLLDQRMRVDRLAAKLGVSERQLRRRFDAGVGYGPKTLQRILRLRHALRLANGDLARVAAEAGFADQAHMTREFRRLTGASPSELLRAT